MIIVITCNVTTSLYDIKIEIFQYIYKRLFLYVTLLVKSVCNIEQNLTYSYNLGVFEILI